MTFDAHKNFAYSIVAVAPSPAATGTTLTVHVGDGPKFPTPPFNAPIWPIGSLPLNANAEIVRVTAITGDVLTISRAQEGTTARSILPGYQISAAITAKTLADVETAVTAEVSRAQVAEANALAKAADLADLADPSAARTNLGLGSAATQPSSAFDAAGTAASAVATETSRAQAAEALALTKAANLGDLQSASSARANLGLGTAATQAATAFDTAGAATAAVAAETARAEAAEALALTKTNNLSDLASIGIARATLGLDRLAHLRSIFRSTPLAAIEAPATGVLRAYRKLGGTTDLWEAEELAQLAGLPGGFLVNQAWRRFAAFPVRLVADTDGSITKGGTWTNSVVQAAAPFGEYSYTAASGGTATITVTGKRLAAGIVTASNGAIWTVGIDGDNTAASLCPTVQDLVTSGALVSTALVANGGTLQPTQRVLDCYSATAAYNNIIGLAEYATSASHTVLLTNSGYANVASSGTRCYFMASGYQDATTSILTAGVAMASHRWFLTSVQSAKEFALESIAPGQPGAQFTGNVHGCEQMTSIAVTVDGLPVTPTVLGGLTVGQSIEILRTSQVKQPGGTGLQSNGSNILTGVTWPGAFSNGDTIYGYGIPPGTTVTAVNAGAGTITMSANGTLNATTLLVTSKNLWSATTVYRYGAEGILTRVLLDATAMTTAVTVDKAYAGMDPVDATFARADVIAPRSALGVLASQATAGTNTVTLVKPLNSQIIPGQHLLLDEPGAQEEVTVSSVNTGTGVVTLTANLLTTHAAGATAYRTMFRLSLSDLFFGQIPGDGAIVWNSTTGLASLLVVPDPDRSAFSWAKSGPLHISIQDRSSPPLTKAYITVVNTNSPAITIGPGGQTQLAFTSLRAGALLANPDQVLPR